MTLLDIAIGLAETHGYDKITREQISRAAGVATGTVTNHLGTMRQMRRKIVRHATRTDNKRIIAQAIINQEPYTLRLSIEDRTSALQSML